MDIKQSFIDLLTLDEASSQKGTRHWRMQRISAIVVLICAVYLIFTMARFFHQPYLAASTWLSNGFNATIMFIFVFATFYHLSKGVEMIIEDYVSHDLASKLIHFTRWAAAILALIGMVSVINSCGVQA